MADAVRDGRHLMEQPERRVQWWRPSEMPLPTRHQRVHARIGWLGIEDEPPPHISEGRE